jgi:hypothetical protein
MVHTRFNRSVSASTLGHFGAAPALTGLCSVVSCCELDLKLPYLEKTLNGSQESRLKAEMLHIRRSKRKFFDLRMPVEFKSLSSSKSCS